MPSDVTLLYLIKQVELAVRSQLDEVVSAEGLSVPQYTALTVLERHPGLTAAQLARNSFVRQQSMAQLIDVLEARGLVMRESDPANRRQRLLSLTLAGAQLLDNLQDHAHSVEQRMVAQLTDYERDELRRMLTTCRLELAGSTPSYGVSDR